MLSLLLLLGAGQLALVAGQDDQYCLARDQYPYLYFGPKTAYERVYDHKDSPQNVPFCRPRSVWSLIRAGTSYPDYPTLVRLHETLPALRDAILQHAMEQQERQPQQKRKRGRGGHPWAPMHCRPLTLWFMGRPGTRYPDEDTIRKMQSLEGLKTRILRNHDGRGGRLCPEDLAALARWHLNVTEDKALWLTGQGQADLSFLARRLKRRLPELLNNTYGADRFRFRYTASQRTQESAEAFASGLFVRGVEMPAPVQNDPLLQFDEMCPSWRDNRPRADEEVAKFERGPEMEQSIARVSRRLGFNYNLSMENIDLMWEMCRYDKAWKYVSLSPWCAAFTEDDLKVMEYRADLQYYYRYSYGDQLNVDLGCPPVKDMLDHFSRMESATAEDGYENVPPPVGVFYFAHDAVLHMMLAALGAERDSVPLMANNMDQQAKRLFRTSYIGSFAANLAAVFYQCDQGEKHRVMFYLRERIVDMEGCQVGLCSWSHLRTRLRKAQVCSLKFCKANGAAAAAPSRTLLAAVAAVAAVAVLARRS